MGHHAIAAGGHGPAADDRPGRRRGTAARPAVCPRFLAGEEAIEIVTQPIARPFKLGYLNHAGWLAYRYGGVTFTKRWTPRPAQRHVDFGCNAEVYTNDRHLELETLGPLVRLSPGESVEHVEAWEVGATDSN